MNRNLKDIRNELDKLTKRTDYKRVSPFVLYSRFAEEVGKVNYKLISQRWRHAENVKDQDNYGNMVDAINWGANLYERALSYSLAKKRNRDDFNTVLAYAALYDDAIYRDILELISISKMKANVTYTKTPEGSWVKF